MTTVRVLFLADTHLGFDHPVRPRVHRRRRGDDFFANYVSALEAAVERDVDLVIHGGDLLYRSRVPPALVHRAFQPLKRVAESGIPVFIVPGNHERSRIPHAMLAIHPRIHVFHRPTTLRCERQGVRVALSGFPYCRDRVRDRFSTLLQSTRWSSAPADLRLLCVHHCFEGATVGPHDYTFRFASDVVRPVDVPTAFAAVLTGHVHRHQVLTRDLGGQRLAVPIVYPGSTERTSFAERDERKGFLILHFRTGRGVAKMTDSEFCPLPARPMVIRDVDWRDRTRAEVEAELRRVLQDLPPDGVVRLRVHGTVTREARPLMSAGFVRSVAPATMNVEVLLVDERR